MAENKISAPSVEELTRAAIQALAAAGMNRFWIKQLLAHAAGKKWDREEQLKMVELSFAEVAEPLAKENPIRVALMDNVKEVVKTFLPN